MANTKIQKEYLDDELPHVLSGASAPSSTPAKVGNIYIDTTNDNSYIAVGTSSSADWKINGGGGVYVGCSVTRSGTQSLSTNTYTALQFNSEDFDTDTMHDNTTNNTRITFNTAGKYLVTGFGPDISNNCAIKLKIRLNGTTDILEEVRNNTSSGAENICLTTIRTFSVADYIELFANSISGAFNANANGDIRFSATLLST